MKCSKYFSKAAVLFIAIAMLATSFAAASHANTLVETPAVGSTDKDVVFEDGFETYPDFALDFPPWTNVDLDGTVTWGAEATDFENENYVGSFIAFDAATCSPPVNDEESGWMPYEGTSYAACFAANPSEGPMNDDWLISPLVSDDGVGGWFGFHCVSRDSFVLMIDDVIVTSDGAGTFTVSFWATSLTDAYGLDRFQFGYSTAGTDPATFTIISEGDYVEAPLEWTQFTYEFVGDEVEEDNTAPESTITVVDGEMEEGVYVTDVTLEISATDDMSGVAEINYRVDGGSWMTYASSFVVSGNGAHTVEYYAVDGAGNEEEINEFAFDIAYPPEIVINSIAGGFGKVSVEAENIGIGNGVDLPYSIAFDGGLVLTGAVEGTVNIAAGETATLESGFVIGFGATTIVVEVDDATANQNATVLLVFVNTA